MWSPDISAPSANRNNRRRFSPTRFRIRRHESSETWSNWFFGRCVNNLSVVCTEWYKLIPSCLKFEIISRPSAARQLGQPMHSKSANFGKLDSHSFVWKYGTFTTALILQLRSSVSLSQSMIGNLWGGDDRDGENTENRSAVELGRSHDVLALKHESRNPGH